MLCNALIWIYIFFTTYVTGMWLIRVLSGRKTFSGKDAAFHFEDISILGLAGVTVYAQFFSLFGGVGLIANIILSSACVVLLLIAFRKSRPSFPDFRKKLPGLILVFLAALLMLYGSSRGYFHYDSDLYHGQAIHWIEDYGVVRGLGKLDGRLAYNSSSFALSALYSFAYLSGRSFHACAGYLGFMVLISCLRVLHVFSDRKLRLSDFPRLAAVYYIGNIYDEIVSPASDYFTMLLFLYCVIKLCDACEAECDEDARITAFAIPSLIAVFDLTVKLSAAPFVIAVLIPLYLLMKKKDVRSILRYACASVITVLPFFIRNYIISGWLLYPSVSIDIFDPEWKIGREFAVADKDYIVAFGRGFSNMGAAHLPVSEWLPHWFSLLGRTEKIMFVSSVLGLAVFAAAFLILFLKKKKDSRMKECVILACAVSFAFWLFSSPLVRYGQGYLILMPALTFGYLITSLDIKKLNSAVIVLIGLFLVYKSCMRAGYIYDNRLFPYYVLPEDYGVYETYPVSIGNTYVYAPAAGDRTGYYSFPSVPSANGLPEMYDPEGVDLSMGFR